MNTESKKVERVYLILTLFTTLSASFIWGINTLFLLDAGLSNVEAFAANAFFTVGQLIFEIPTGVIADTWGRRQSFLLGAFTLIVSTLLYLYMWQISASFLGWAVASTVLGLGFTFFSGAVEAWLVDCLTYTNYQGEIDPVFAKGQIVGGIAMLTGSVAGGVVAQFTNLGVPYILRSIMLVLTLIVAFIYMKDLGFEPTKNKDVMKAMKGIVSASIDNGLRNRPVRWVMLAAPFSAGVGMFAFYAMQPYLLELYGNPEAYSIAGLAAAIVAGAQILGGMSVSKIRRLFDKRTSILIGGGMSSVIVLTFIGLIDSFWIAVVLLVFWAMIYAATMPVRQAYLNGLIPSKQRATVLSFDSLMSSGGGVVTQPLLGKAADVYSYSTAYIMGAGIQLLAVPFLWLARRENPESDSIKN
jgi:MFS family permease